MWLWQRLQGARGGALSPSPQIYGWVAESLLLQAVPCTTSLGRPQLPGQALQPPPSLQLGCCQRSGRSVLGGTLSGRHRLRLKVQCRLLTGPRRLPQGTRLGQEGLGAWCWAEPGAQEPERPKRTPVAGPLPAADFGLLVPGPEVPILPHPRGQNPTLRARLLRGGSSPESKAASGGTWQHLLSQHGSGRPQEAPDWSWRGFPACASRRLDAAMHVGWAISLGTPGHPPPSPGPGGPPIARPPLHKDRLGGRFYPQHLLERAGTRGGRSGSSSAQGRARSLRGAGAGREGRWGPQGLGGEQERSSGFVQKRRAV